MGILLGLGDSTIQEALRYGVGDEPRSVALGDLDDDGIVNGCDTRADDADEECRCVDDDGHGYGYGCPGNPTCDNGAAEDCDDTSPKANPGHPEVSRNGTPHFGGRER